MVFCFGNNAIIRILMKTIADKIPNKSVFVVLGTLLIIIVALSAWWFTGFVDQKILALQEEVEERDERIAQMDAETKSSIKNLESLLLSTASSLESVLEQEQQKNNSLKAEFESITSTVGNLEKLSNTDPELLKKYSKVYFLNEHYVPITLKDIPSEYASNSATNFQLHADVLPYLEDLMEDASDDGLGLLVQSAYRSFSTQSTLKANYTMTYGSTAASRFSADQGYSEHQLGTTVDFTTFKSSPSLTGFDKTPEYEWLKNNAHKYGFVLSYPEGNTYYKFEPWHWRFVGRELAERLHDDNISFYDADQRTIDSYLASLFD